jgi:hypothetical protein
MLTLSSVVLCVALAGGDHSSEGSADAPRPYHQIREEMSAALRAEAVAKTQEARSRAVGEILALYAELKRDPRLEGSDTLKSYKAKLWSRMRSIQRDLERELARREDSPGRARTERELQQLAAATRSAAEQVAALHYALGGPALMIQQHGGAMGGGTVNDYSQQLIDLIERTIRPDFWDTNGGPGAIVYYRPLMALVVTATSEVHGSVGGVLGALRAANN